MACSFSLRQWLLPQLLAFHWELRFSHLDLCFIPFIHLVLSPCPGHFLSGSNLLMLVFYSLAIRLTFSLSEWEQEFSLTSYLFASFSSTDPHSHSDASILGILVFALQKKDQFPLFPVSFSVITLYCFIRCFADKFFVILRPSLLDNRHCNPSLSPRPETLMIMILSLSN